MEKRRIDKIVDSYTDKISLTNEQFLECLDNMIQAKETHIVMEGYLYEHQSYSPDDIRYQLLALRQAKEIVQKELSKEKTYSFSVECIHTVEHCSEILYGDETYTFETKDFKEFKVCDKNNVSFILTDLWQIADDIEVRKADKETIEMLHEQFYNEALGTRMYAELGVRYGLLSRFEIGYETMRDWEDRDVEIDEFEDGLVTYIYGKTLVDEDHDSFYYKIGVEIDSLTLSYAQRVYCEDVVPAKFSDEQVKIILETAAKDIKEYCTERTSKQAQRASRENCERD